MKTIKVFAFKICLLCFVGCAVGFNGFTRLFNAHEEPPINADAYKSTVRYTANEKWIRQKLDHFNPQDQREWNMRYLENERFFEAGGPIFIFIGGEWEITPGYISAGLMFDMAKELHGMMYYTEHRYYGKSHPTDDTSTKNLQFLTVEQALADLAHFIQNVKASSNELKNSGVILVGCSYAGSLATWARQKYPHLVNGAWASSAPLFAKFDFSEWNELMTESVRRIGGEKCLRKFAEAIKLLEDYAGFSEPRVLAKIKSDFNLCEPLKLCRDVANFFYEIQDNVAALVQRHRTDEIQKACQLMLDEKHADATAALGAWVNGNEKKCLDMNYHHSVAKFTNVTWGSEANKQLRQWTYQTCDSFGWFQSITSSNQVFGVKHPQLGYFAKMCAELFDNQFNYNSIRRNVKKTNAIFGGFDPHVTNVYTTQGNIDPWRAMGLQRDLNSEAPVVILDNYSHCADLQSISNSDSPQMKASKGRVFELVKKWLNLSRSG